MRSSASIAVTSRCSLLVVVAACAAAPVTGSLGNHVASAPAIRLARDGELGPRPSVCATTGDYRPDLGARIRAFAAAELVKPPARIAREKILELPSQGTLDEAASSLATQEVAMVLEPRDHLGILWLVYPKFQAVYCIHVRGDEIVLERALIRITRTLE